jgi:hypothetical protein
MFLLSSIVITLVTYYLLTTQSIILGENTLRCTTTLLKKQIITREINFIHVNNENQVTNIFTKALGIDKLRKFRKMLGVLEVDLSLSRTVENSSSTS